ANEKQKQRKFFTWFNRKVEQGQSSYRIKLLAVLGKPKIFMIIFLGITALLGWQYTRMNTGFLPQEDQGSVMVQFSTPVGTTL
ncbi:efflux RND transporter permease subunit, partial [Acinetobacter baumannii]